MTNDTDRDREAFSAYCRKHVGRDAKEVADLANVPRRTFYDWWRSRRTAVELIIEGIKYRQVQNHRDESVKEKGNESN